MTKKIISIALVTLAALSAGTPSICMFQKLKQFTPTIKAFSLLKPTSYNFSRPLSTKKTFPLMRQIIDSEKIDKIFKLKEDIRNERYEKKRISLCLELFVEEFDSEILRLEKDILKLKQEILNAVKQQDTYEIECKNHDLRYRHNDLAQFFSTSKRLSDPKYTKKILDLAMNVGIINLSVFDSVLYDACRDGNLDLVKSLLNHRAKINYNKNPIFIAYLKGNLEILKELLSKYPEKIDKPNEEGESGGPVQHDGSDLGSFTPSPLYGKTLFELACKNGDVEMIKYIKLTQKYNKAENKEQFVMSKIQDTEEFEFLKEMHANRKK